MSVTVAEIRQAQEELRLAREALNWADPDFIKVAVYQYKTAEARLDALLKRAKNAGIVQFPEIAEYPNREERIMDYIGIGILVTAVLLFISVVVINAGRIIGLWG